MIEPYINLNGLAQEALDFYEKVFNGTDKKVSYIQDSSSEVPEYLLDYIPRKIAQAQITLCGTTLNLSDMQIDGLSDDSKISLMVKLDSITQAKQIFEQLSVGGDVLMAPDSSSYSDFYAWIKDKFGIGWQLICEK